MIRDRLRRWASEARRGALEEQDSSQVRVYTAPWVVPGAGSPIRDGAVVFDTMGRVLACGNRAEIIGDFGWAQQAELGGVLLPGLVNAHSQFELGAIPPHTGVIGLRNWLRKLREVRRETEQLAPDSREALVRAGVQQSVRAGTAAVGDVTNSLRAVPAMAREGLYGVVFHEITGFSPRRAAKALAAAAVAKARIVPWPDGIRYLLAPHAPYSTSGAVIKELCHKAIEMGAVTSIRLAEGEEEWDLLETGKGAARSLVETVELWWDEFSPPGTDPMAYIEDLGALHEKVMLVHMTTATREMARKASSANSPLVLCPRTSQQVSGRLPPLVSFLEEGCRVALGTAAAANTPDQSILREAAELHAAFPEVPALVLMTAATAGGGDALGLEGMGSLSPGGAPGLLHAATPGGTPDDPCGWLLRAGNPELNWLERAAPPGAAFSA